MGLPKEHACDAIAIASIENIERDGLLSVTVKARLLRKAMCAKGRLSSRPRACAPGGFPQGKIHGFRKFDKVRYDGPRVFH